MNRIDVIKYCIGRFGYTSYLEIGCQNDYTFNQVNVPGVKVGVDPFSGGTHRMTSDEFFAQNTQKFDLIFIDGDHRCRQVFKDITNSLDCLTLNGIIIAHDCNPPTKADESTENIRCSDAWKAFVHFRQQRCLSTACGNFDFGVGLLKHDLRTGIDSNQLNSLDREFTSLTWDELVLNRKSWLNLLEPDEIVDWLEMSNNEN